MFLSPHFNELCDFTDNKLSRVVVFACLIHIPAHSYQYPTFITGITVSGITVVSVVRNIVVVNEAAENDQAC